MQVIQWFPGHMAKAKREILEVIKLVDLVIELKDARIPFSSTNPLIDEIVGNKPRLVLLCKCSMADPVITRSWIDYYRTKGLVALDIDSITGYHLKDVIKYAERCLADVFLERKKKGITSKSIKAMILGIPNVGKSTLINSLAKRKATNVGDRPGVTKHQSWIKVSDDLYLLDTPGILWPKFDDQDVGLKLAMCGSIKDDILDINAIVLKSIEYLLNYYPDKLMARYDIKLTNPQDILDQIGKKRGFLLKGGIVDIDRVNTMFLNELRSTRIGVMSYERPND